MASAIAASVPAVLGLGALVEAQDRDRGHAHGAEQGLVLLAGLGRREAVGMTATRASVPPASSMNRRRIAPSRQALLGPADRDDESAFATLALLLPDTPNCCSCAVAPPA